jgi:hypothetical protein
MTDLQAEALEATITLNATTPDGDLFTVKIFNKRVIIDLHLQVSGAEIKISIYDSRNDDRIFYPKLNREEKLTALLRRKFREIKKDLNKIKI